MWYKIHYKYYIYLFRNKKLHKIIYKSAKCETILKKWKALKAETKPPYVVENTGARGGKAEYELVLVGPKPKNYSPIYTKDDLGRTIEAKLSDPTKRIKAIIPYWEEELIHDYQIKKRISFNDLIDFILTIQGFGQIFTLNNNLFVQIDDDIYLFGNKNLDDTQRLFNAVKTELFKRKVGNFLFVKDITTHQRKILYDLLEEKGFKRTKLFKHYSR